MNRISGFRQIFFLQKDKKDFCRCDTDSFLTPAPVLTQEACRERIVLFIVVLITAAAWGSVIWGSFQYDDYANVITDPATTQWSVFLQRIFSGIRPLTRASYFLDHIVWGMSAGGFLLTNLILHILTTMGVFHLARCRPLSLYGSGVAALIFALQPAHAETVAYVSGRSTGLMTCLLAWSLVVHDRVKGRFSWQAVSLFVAACLAKEVALIFPGLVLIWETTRPRRYNQMRPNWKNVALYISIAITTLVVLATSPRARDLIAYSLTLRGPAENLMIQLRAIPATLALWFRPDILTVDHHFALYASSVEYIAGGLVLTGMAALALASYRQARTVTLALGWTLLALAPTHSIIARLDVVTEKPLYLGWVGFSILVGSFWQNSMTALAKPFQRSLVTITLAITMGIAAGTCINRIHVWSDGRLLWTEAVTKNPASSRAWNNLGLALMADHPEMAASSFAKALELNPDSREAADNLLYTEWWENR